jgi:uncharacterized protein YcnI
VAGLLAVPVAANVNIPEGGAVARDGVSVINVRVLDGCEGEATDRIEVQIPEAVSGVVPAHVPGRSVEVETAAAEETDAESDGAETTAEIADDENVTLVRWTGGPLPAGQFMDFGMRAYFPDEAGMTVAFPVVQGCGLTEIVWDGERDSENPAPLVSIGNHVGQRDLGELQDTVETLSADLTSLTEQLEGVDPTTLQGRLGDVESRIDERLPELVERMNRLADRIGALEEPTDDTAGADDGSS